MEPLRKPLGFFILVFIALPALFAVTWAVGITRAVSRPDFLPELPQRIAEELPVTVDLLFEAAQQPGAVDDEQARTWILAAAEAKTRPGELLEEIGLLDWCRNDLSFTLHQLYGALSGQRHMEVITLDFRPLKAALSHEAVDRYFLEVVDHLPPCTPREQKVWESIGRGRRHRGGLPACRPDHEAVMRVAGKLERRSIDLPREVEVLDTDDLETTGLDLLSIALAVSLILFVVPGFFIALGAFVAEPMNFKAFKWSGISVLVAGLAVLITAALPKGILKLVTAIIGWAGAKDPDLAYWPPGLVNETADKVYGLCGLAIDPLLSPVFQTALFVCLAGAVLWGIHLLKRESEGRPPIPRT